MNVAGQSNKPVLLLTLVIFISRLPFLFSGYGSEEDAWGLILTARNIDLNGVYEVSRMPGHPVQELLLSLVWNQPSWLLNLFTAIISTTGIYYFMLTLRLWGIRNYHLAGAFIAFVPVYYINSTNIMDYTWALSLVMIAMYLLVSGRVIFAGILLGLACGIRITAGAMVVPFMALLLFQPDAIKKILVIGTTTSLVALICFIPALDVYGTGFFTYYEYFPYPPFLKNIYKGTVGAWGIPGMLALAMGAAAVFKNRNRMDFSANTNMKALMLMSCITIAIYSYAFIRIPQKSAFVIPMIPFIAIIFSLLLTRKQMLVATIMMVASCFLFGINLDDKIRGSNTTPLAYKTTIGNTPVAIDPLVGTFSADQLKRIQKITYAKQIVSKMNLVREKTVIVAGWWQNELNYFSLENKNPNVTYVYYADENQLRDSILTGNKIYYLPEQDFYNDLRFNKKFTAAIASPVD